MRPSRSRPADPWSELLRAASEPRPAALAAGLWSLALHGAVAAWFLASGAGPNGSPTATAAEVPIYVTLVSEPAPEAKPDQEPVPTPEQQEPADTDAAPTDLPPVPETMPEPLAETEIVNEPPPPAAKPAAAPRLAAVRPPSRPARPQQAPVAQPVPAAMPEPLGSPPRTPGPQAPPVGRPASFPVYLSNPHPAYPARELSRGREGLVMLSVRVTPEGRAEAVSVHRSSGIAAFDREALRAVRGWRFLPATRAGRPVTGTVTVPVRFVLRKSQGD
jgi:protein TonB